MKLHHRSANGILRLKDYTTTQVRINILDAKAAPVISEVQLYKAPGLLHLPQIGRTSDGKVWIHSESGDPDIHYTLDGSEPTVKSPKYICRKYNNQPAPGRCGTRQSVPGQRQNCQRNSHRHL